MRGVPSQGRNIRVNNRAVTYGSDIPDSEDLHSRYDNSDISDASTLIDLAGDNDLSVGDGNPSVITDDKNGLNVVDYTSNDYHNVAYSSSITQPIHLFAVMQITNIDAVGGGEEYLIAGGDAGDTRDLINVSGSHWRMDSGSFIDGGSPDTNWHVLNVLYNGQDSHLRVDGTQVISEDAGTSDVSGLTVSATFDGVASSPLKFGELLQYPQDKSNIETDVEQYLADKWDITL